MYPLYKPGSRYCSCRTINCGIIRSPSYPYFLDVPLDPWCTSWPFHLTTHPKIVASLSCGIECIMKSPFSSNSPASKILWLPSANGAVLYIGGVFITVTTNCHFVPCKKATRVCFIPVSIFLSNYPWVLLSYVCSDNLASGWKQFNNQYVQIYMQVWATSLYNTCCFYMCNITDSSNGLCMW